MALFPYASEEDNQSMWLFVGLGNPGDKYVRNRHNIGFMVIDEIADGAIAFPPMKKKFEAQISEAKSGTSKILLVKPQTYMNESGRSVGAAAKFYKIPADRIVVFHDELDLKPGEVRFKKGGGNAGHNGLKSIQAHLGTPDFWRVRIGIGHPGEKSKVSNYVLNDFAKSDQIWLEQTLDALSGSYAQICTQGVDAYETSVKSYLKACKEG